MVRYVALWCNVGQYGASFRLYFCLQIWATKLYLGQHIYNKFNEKRANKQQIKEDKNI